MADLPGMPYAVRVVSILNIQVKVAGHPDRLRQLGHDGHYVAEGLFS